MVMKSAKVALGILVVVSSAAAVLYVLGVYAASVSKAIWKAHDVTMLLVHVAVPVLAAVFVPVFFSRRGDQLTIRSVFALVVLLVFLAVAVMYGKEVEDFRSIADYIPLHVGNGTEESLLTDSDVSCLKWISLAVIGGLALAAYFKRLTAMTEAKRDAVAVVVVSSLITLWIITEAVVRQIHWSYFGSIHVFCWMITCWLVLPLMVLVFGLMFVTADEGEVNAPWLFCAAGLSAVLLANVAVEEFVRSGGLRAPRAMLDAPLSGVCRLLATGSLMRAGMAVITVLAALVLVGSRARRRRSANIT